MSSRTSPTASAAKTRSSGAGAPHPSDDPATSTGPCLPAQDQRTLQGDIEAQATLVLDNIKAVVEAAGFSLKNVLKAEVFMKDLKDFGKYNAIYVKYFPQDPPARVTVQAAALPRDVLIEISVTCGK
ncbi:MAG: hypothetical protein IPI61_08560 [Syntrophaceae bacterium]|nr:hypothetical protein [Syntrophaceae bacterium]